MQFVFQMKGLGALALGQLADRDTCPAGHDAADLIVRHAVVYEGVLSAVRCLLALGQFFAKLGQAAVLQLRGTVQIAVLLRDLDLAADRIDLLTQSGQIVGTVLLILPLGFFRRKGIFEFRQFLLEIFKTLTAEFVLFLLEGCFLDLQLQDLALLFVQFRGQRIHLCLDQGAGLIHEVDCLVGKETVRNIAVGKHGCADKSIVEDLHAVVDLVAFLQAAEDGNRVFYRRFIHQHGLETALKSSVLLDVLSVLLEGRCTDAVKLAAGQHGFEHIAGIHGALGLAGTDDGMQFIDEEQDLALAPLDILKDRFETFLEFAPVLGTGHKRAHIQREDLLVLQAVRNIATGDPLCQPLDNGCLADTGLTDQNRVVLGLSGKDPDHIADLGIPADHGIHLLRPGLGNKFFAVFFQGVIGRLGIVAGHALVAAHCGQSLEKSLPVDAVVLEQAFQRAVRVLDQGQEEVLDTDILIAKRLCLALCAQQGLIHLSAHINARVAALNLGEALYGALDAVFKGARIDAHFLDQLENQAVLEREQAVEQVLLFDLLIAVFICQLFTLVDRFY